MGKGKGLDRFQWKLIMVALMVLDHLYMIPGLLSPKMIIFFHGISRPVAVFFAYIAVEGFLYTSSRKKYISRLFFAAGIMAIGSELLYRAGLAIPVRNNIFLTLAIGVSMLYLFYDDESKPWWKVLLGTFLLLLGIFIGEGGFLLLPFMIITYEKYGKERERNVAYLLFSLMLLVITLGSGNTVEERMAIMAVNPEWLFILLIPILRFYNGEPGRSGPWAKNFFYLFYPLHLWGLAILAKALGA